MTESDTHDSAGRRILAINLGWEQERLLRRLGERGLNVWGVHYEEDYESYVEYEDVLISDIRDLNAILDYATEVDPDAVISNQDDYAQFAQALVAKKLNLPGPRVAEAQVAGNKLLQRRRCQELGLPIPNFTLCTNQNDVLDFVASQGYPIILKPIDNRGGIGVKRVDDEDDIEHAFFQALIASHSRLVLAEECVEGTQIVIDGYARPGVGCVSLALGSKRMIEGASTVARDIVYPGDISEPLYREAIDLNESVNEALGIRFGPTHSEYMITEDGEIILVETANRGGGVHISEVVTPAVSDFDLVENYINDALGNETSELSSPARNEVWMRFLTFTPGTVSAIKGVDEVLEEPDVLHVQVMFEEGDTIGTVSNDVDRHGYIIAETNDRGRIEEIANSINIKYI